MSINYRDFRGSPASNLAREIGVSVETRDGGGRTNARYYRRVRGRLNSAA